MIRTTVINVRDKAAVAEAQREGRYIPLETGEVPARLWLCTRCGERPKAGIGSLCASCGVPDYLPPLLLLDLDPVCSAAWIDNQPSFRAYEETDEEAEQPVVGLALSLASGLVMWALSRVLWGWAVGS